MRSSSFHIQYASAVNSIFELTSSNGTKIYLEWQSTSLVFKKLTTTKTHFTKSSLKTTTFLSHNFKSQFFILSSSSYHSAQHT